MKNDVNIQFVLGQLETKTNTEISFSFWLTLFYSIPLLALTDGRTDRGTNTLASRGLEEPFFQLCCMLWQVFGSGGKKVLVQIRMYYLEYNTVVVVC